MATRFERSAEARNLILRALRRDPGAPLHRLYWATYIERRRLSQHLLRMEQIGEVRREPGGVDTKGQACSKWYALVERTVPAKKVTEHIAKNLKGDGSGRKAQKRAGERRSITRIPEIKHRLFGGL